MIFLFWIEKTYFSHNFWLSFLSPHASCSPPRPPQRLGRFFLKFLFSGGRKRSPGMCSVDVFTRSPRRFSLFSVVQKKNISQIIVVKKVCAKRKSKFMNSWGNWRRRCKKMFELIVFVAQCSATFEVILKRKSFANWIRKSCCSLLIRKLVQRCGVQFDSLNFFREHKQNA